MVEYKVMSYLDREKLVMALVNSGYTVKVEERPDPNRYLSKEYFVQVLDVDNNYSDKENTYNINVNNQVVSKADAEKLMEHLQKYMKRSRSGVN